MWEDFIADRAKNNVDELCATFEYDELPKFQEVYPRGYYGHDRVGRPLFIDNCGRINPDDIWKVTT